MGQLFAAKLPHKRMRLEAATRLLPDQGAIQQRPQGGIGRASDTGRRFIRKAIHEYGKLAKYPLFVEGQ